MSKYSIRCGFLQHLLLVILLLEFMLLSHLDFAYTDSGRSNSFTVSSFRYPETRLKPYEWRYIRVDLPPFFSSMYMTLESDAKIDLQSIHEVSTSALPLICLRDGSLPLPDFSRNSFQNLVLASLPNGSIEAIKDLQNAQHCYPVQKTITLGLTSDQIPPGVWYFGLFNGAGAMRTQSKMISRGSALTFAANVTVEGCTVPNLWGQYCNKTVESLLCSQSLTDGSMESGSVGDLFNRTVVCRNSGGYFCHGNGKTRVFFLEVLGLAEHLTITANNIKINGATSTNKTNNSSGVALTCYVRNGVVPLAALHDYVVDLSEGPLVIQLPKIGRWYISIVPMYPAKVSGRTQNRSSEICYSLAWKVADCPFGKAGVNCTSESFMLQTVLRKNPSAPFESYYVPMDGNLSSNAANFPLEPLFINSSMERKKDAAYFVLDIPAGAAGGNMHIRLTADRYVNYEVYVRSGGVPSLNFWDYYYVSKANSSDGSMFFKLYNSSKEVVDFYVMLVREGTWSIAIRQHNSTNRAPRNPTTMSISLERCPKRCSPPHGSCQNFVDESGLTLYSFCTCDRTHGGVDCSVEIITPQDHMWQSFFLVASNAAAILPSYWSLRCRAFPEWVIFTSSGIFSGLYHACDVGTWCALSFRVLQFMDFWLSFVAVVSTFIYLTAIDEVSRRTIQAVVFILTAIMAISGATRPANIILVIAIGTAGLLIGWVIEFSRNYRSFSLPRVCSFNVLQWCAPPQWRPNIRSAIRNVIKKFLKRFKWILMLAGFVALTMAAISWKLETSRSYWIWHSIWHVSIYTSSFFFLCSKATTMNSENQVRQDVDYELTRQDSMPRG